MRRIVIALMSTLSGLVLLFSYHTSTNAGAAVATGRTTGGTSGGASDGTASDTTNGSGSGSGSGSAESSGAKSYTGDEVMTRWGVVQVQIEVQSGKITASQALQVPNGNRRDDEINSYAVPILNQLAVQAQSADFDNISGATVTTDGYKQSLQSAIDQAHL